jgi:hypothetical protein
MTYTADFNALFNPQLKSVVQETADLFKGLSVDDQLGLLWFIYTETGYSITPAAPGAARLQFAEGLLNQIQTMPQADQLKVMRDLVSKVGTPISRAYGVLSANTKLAFWYQLAEFMREGTVVPVPTGYKLSRDADRTFAAIKALDFGQQITVLRKIVVDMGANAF